MPGFGMEDLQKLGLTEQEIIQLTGAESNRSFRGPVLNWRRMDIESREFKIGFAASVAYSSGEYSVLARVMVELGRIAES